MRRTLAFVVVGLLFNSAAIQAADNDSDALIPPVDGGSDRLLAFRFELPTLVVPGTRLQASDLHLPPARVPGADRLPAYALDLPPLRVPQGAAAVSARVVTAAATPNTPDGSRRIARSVNRPASLRALSVAYQTLNALDWLTTAQALKKTGYKEMNPILAPVASNSAALLVTKSAIAAVTVYAAERLGRRHRKVAIAAMVAANLVSGFAVAHNAKLR